MMSLIADWMVCTSCGRRGTFSKTERLCRTCESKEKEDGFECACGEWDAPSNWFKGTLLTGSCFDCSHWEKLVGVSEEPRGSSLRSVRIDGRHYQFDSRQPIKSGRTDVLGHAGRKFTIVFSDGASVVTNNLWFQGEIPERFRERLPNNANFKAANES